MVQVFSGLNQVLPDFTDFTGFYRALLGSTAFHRVKCFNVFVFFFSVSFEGFFFFTGFS